LPVKVIAAQLGFENVFYFSKVFKQFTGVSPSEFKALHRCPIVRRAKKQPGAKSPRLPLTKKLFHAVLVSFNHLFMILP